MNGRGATERQRRMRRSQGRRALPLLLLGLLAILALVPVPAMAASAFPQAAITDVSCPSANLCVGVDSVGNVLTSTNPTGGASAWTLTRIRHVVFPNGFTAVSCASSALCVAVDGDNDFVSSTDPTGGSAAWALARVESSEFPEDVSCPSTALCVAVDDAGDAVTATNPTGGPAAWTATSIPGGIMSMRAIDCPATSLCVATSYSAGFSSEGSSVFTTSNPTGGPGAWQEAASLAGRPSLSSIDCASAALCVAGAQGAVGPVEGVYTSTNPTGGPSAWTEAALGYSISSVSCPTVNFCAAGDFNGHILTSTNPTAGPSAWMAASIDPSQRLTAISCPTTSLCVATDGGGNVLTSTNPTGGAAAWSLTHVDNEVENGEPEEVEEPEVEQPGGGNATPPSPPVGSSSASPPPTSPPAPQPSHSKASASGTADVQTVAQVKGGRALLSVRCPAGGPACRGVVKLVASLPQAKHPDRADRRQVQKRVRRVVIGTSRYRAAAGAKVTFRIKITRLGESLLTQAGRTGLKVQLAGTGIQARSVWLKRIRQIR